MRPRKDLQYTFRLYLNADGKRVLGKGGAQILEAIDQYGSITVAAKHLHMSYKFVWDYLTRMRSRLKKTIIMTHRGGMRRRGGGGATLTPLAKTLLRNYWATERRLNRALSKRRIPISRR
jgi:molybdate transport system regulatory protein